MFGSRIALLTQWGIFINIIRGCIVGKHPLFWSTAGGKDMLAGSTHWWENQPEVAHTPLLAFASHGIGLELDMCW